MSKVVNVLLCAVVLGAVAYGGVGIASAARQGSCRLHVRTAGRTFTGDLGHNSRTSCPFARNVFRVATGYVIRHGGSGDGDFYVFAWLPVTGRWYHAHGLANGDIYDRTYGVRIDCRAGHGARVVYTAFVR